VNIPREGSSVRIFFQLVGLVITVGFGVLTASTSCQPGITFFGSPDGGLYGGSVGGGSTGTGTATCVPNGGVGTPVECCSHAANPVSGACCAPACPGSTLCDTSSDPNNCGTCGNICDARNMICVDGGCECGGSGRVCGGVCSDITTDPHNCGACGTVCPGSDTCCGGTCSAPSDAPTYCGPLCQDCGKWCSQCTDAGSADCCPNVVGTNGACNLVSEVNECQQPDQSGCPKNGNHFCKQCP
jgi:hypothetical protein